VEFRILGPFEVVEGARSIDIGPPKQRAVLALLLLHANQVVSLDKLIDELWGEEPPPRAAGTLQAYISNLRRALEPDRAARERPRVLVTQPPGYVLHIDERALDGHLFEERAAEARRLLAAGNPAEARRLQEEALKLWRGAALADFTFESFAQAEAGRLEELRLVTMEDRLQALIHLGCHGEVVAEAEALAANFPLRERLWELLMLALYRSGRQADALRAYQTARRILGDELGIDPGPRLRALEADVLAQSPALEWEPPDGLETPAPPSPSSAERAPAPATEEASPMVGRHGELARLEVTLGQAGGGRGAVVLITGEPGIGKSRLAEELLARAREHGWQSGWGGSLEGGATPAYWPWVGVVRELLAESDPDVLRQAIAGRAVELAQVIPEVKELSGPIDAPPALDPETARLRLFEAVCGFLAALARHRPLVLVLDDLQWADVASLQLLSFLGARLRDVPLLLVGTYRPAEVGHSHPLADTLAALARQQVSHRVELDGLPAPDVAQLIAATTGSAPDAEVVSTVQARTRGNPFFVAELARLLQSRHELRADVITKAVPAGVRDVVRRRVARLPEETTALLYLAAVAGREFELRVLEVAAELDPDRALEVVEAAVVSGLVVEDHDVVGRLRFSHDLVRETLVDELIALRRARLHARLATALETLYGHDEGRVVELAHHFLSALPAAGAGNTHMADRAITYALRAAEAEMARLAHEEAEDQLRRALEVARSLPRGPERDRRELDVLLPLGSWLTMSRGYAAPETGEVFTAARELCERLGETRHVVRVLYGLMAFNLVAARYDACRQFGEQLLEVATRSGHPGELVAAHQSVAVVALQSGDLRLAHHHLERAFALTEGLHDPWLVSWFPIHPVPAVQSFLAWSVWELGDRERARQLVEDGVDFARRHADDISLAHALHFVGWIAVIDRDPAGAKGAIDELAELARQKGFPLYRALNAVLAGWVQSELGDPAQGVAEIQAAIDAVEATGAWMVHTYFLALLAQAQRRAGRPHDALATLEQAFQFADRMEERFYQPELHRQRGELLLEVSPGRADEAVEELEKALALAREQGNKPLVERAAESLGRVRTRPDRPTSTGRRS
jgi:DNA-binding SARP family transcriptional activator